MHAEPWHWNGRWVLDCHYFSCKTVLVGQLVLSVNSSPSPYDHYNEEHTDAFYYSSDPEYAAIAVIIVIITV